MKKRAVLLTHLQPDSDMENQLEDMTDYVTETLKWAQERMIELMVEDRHEDAIALGAELLAWADESEDTVYCSPDFSSCDEN
jgi:hypothetical protein